VPYRALVSVTLPRGAGPPPHGEETKTVAAAGITVPPQLLAIADDVIE